MLGFLTCVRIFIRTDTVRVRTNSRRKFPHSIPSACVNTPHPFHLREHIPPLVACVNTPIPSTCVRPATWTHSTSHSATQVKNYSFMIFIHSLIRLYFLLSFFSSFFSFSLSFFSVIHWESLKTEVKMKCWTVRDNTTQIATRRQPLWSMDTVEFWRGRGGGVLAVKRDCDRVLTLGCGHNQEMRSPTDQVNFSYPTLPVPTNYVIDTVRADAMIVVCLVG